MTQETRKLGDRGEDAAAAYLERSGLTLVERNWRCPAGEVDIVALEGETLSSRLAVARKTALRALGRNDRIPTPENNAVASHGATPA